MKTQTEIGPIGNYYGGLHLMKQDNKYYWVIENYDTDMDDVEEWHEIPKYLYDALIQYNKFYLESL